MTPQTSDNWIDIELAALSDRGLCRQLRPLPEAGPIVTIDGRRILNFCCNDYLALARHPRVVEASRTAVERYGAGATASRLVSGTLDLHEQLEARLARHKNMPAALVFGSGFLANLGVVTALAGRGDTVFADRLIHASLIDAVKLSGAALKRFRHNDPAHLDALLAQNVGTGRRLVITESVFSMDGDRAPLQDLADSAKKHQALFIVDEAHSCGVSHPSSDIEPRPDIIIGTLSKGMGTYGGCVACSVSMRKWLINKARSFIYTTALPPACLGAAIGALDVLEDDTGMGARLLDNAAEFRNRLRQGGLNTGQSDSQIIPVMVGDNHRTLAMAEKLRGEGLYCVAIRPPTVPEGTARLRLSASLGHPPADLAWAAKKILDVVTHEH